MRAIVASKITSGRSIGVAALSIRGFPDRQAGKRARLLRREDFMKFLMLIKHTENYRPQSVPQGLLDAMGEFVSANLKSGVLKETAGLKPTADGFRVRLSRGQLGT